MFSAETVGGLVGRLRVVFLRREAPVSSVCVAISAAGARAGPVLGAGADPGVWLEPGCMVGPGGESSSDESGGMAAYALLSDVGPMRVS